MRKIAIYFAQQGDLGHIRRILNICDYLRAAYKDKFKLYLFEAGTGKVPFNLPPAIEWRNLPHPFYTKSKFYGARVSPSLPQINARKKFLLEQLNTIKPDVFVTEFFPFGRPECEYELGGILTYLKNKKVRLYASIGQPHFTQKDTRRLFSLCSLYDRILIHTPLEPDMSYFARFITRESSLSCNDYFDVFKKLGKKLQFTGYIIPLDLLKEGRQAHHRTGAYKPIVFVSRGAGAFYPRIISQSILASALLVEGFKFYVVAGPTSTAQEMAIFRRYVKKAHNKYLMFKQYEGRFWQHLGRCGVFVGTCGYNNFAQLLFLQKKAVLIPFTGYLAHNVYTEQLAHAHLLKDYIGSTILEYTALNPQRLAEAIEDTFNNPPGIMPLDIRCFSGGRVTAQEFMY